MFVFRLQVSLDKISNDGPVSLITFEDLKMENERLQVELDRTKKVNCQPSPIPFLIFFFGHFLIQCHFRGTGSESGPASRED